MSLFISLEGPEGGGKSTQALRLAAYLREQGHDVLLTREPGGTDIGDQIRHVITSLDNIRMEPTTEFLLFSASRAQLVHEVIRPALEEGRVVVCDRFFDSSLAYQGYGHRLDLDALRAITAFATQGLKPDLTVLLDLPVEEGLNRRRTEGHWNRLDAYELAFHRRVRRGYLMLAGTEPDRWVVVDADRPAEEIQLEVQQAVRERLKRARGAREAP